MKFKDIIMIAACILAPLAVCGLLQSCGQKNQTDQESTAAGKPLPVVKVQLLTLAHHIDVPGELLAYQDVPIHAKVEGYISWIGVDRGSWVKQGQKMITIYCPELVEKVKESAAKLSSTQSVLAQAKATLQNEKDKLMESQAKLDADSLTYQRLAEAAKTPGAIAKNDVDMAEKTVEADQGRVYASQASVRAAQNVVHAEERNVVAAKKVFESMQDMQSYLTIEAPFDGVISTRNVHVGSIVAMDPSRQGTSLVRIQQVSLLRLVAAVPEDAVGTLHEGNKIPFTVPAYPGKEFEGVVARPAFALEEKTRTMPVELNVPNVPHVLDPGMFCTVTWTVSRPYKTLFLPASAVGTDLSGSFVNKVVNGIAARVSVTKGDTMHNMIEVVGDLKEGDEVALKATDELEDGAKVLPSFASDQDIEAANTNKVKVGGE